MQTPVEIVQLLASPLHRYEGRPKDGPLPFDGAEVHQSIELVAGKGVVGDRYFGKPAHRHESVTIMAIESLEAISDGLDPVKTRRNIMLRGYPVDDLRGVEFQLGEVVLRGYRPANPCAWMDEQLAPGAFRALRGKGGMRCEVVKGGFLKLGPATLIT